MELFLFPAEGSGSRRAARGRRSRSRCPHLISESLRRAVSSRAGCWSCSSASLAPGFTATLFLLFKKSKEASASCREKTTGSTAPGWPPAPGAAAATAYLHLLFVRILVRRQWLLEAVGWGVVFRSGGGLLVKVQLGHQRVAVQQQRATVSAGAQRGASPPPSPPCERVPAGRGGTGQPAVAGLRCLRAEGVGADGRDGSPDQPTPGGDVDVHLRRSQEGFAW